SSSVGTYLVLVRFFWCESRPGTWQSDGGSHDSIVVTRGGRAVLFDLALDRASLQQKTAANHSSRRDRCFSPAACRVHSRFCHSLSHLQLDHFSCRYACRRRVYCSL